VSIEDLFKDLKSLEDLGRENFSYHGKLTNGLVKFRSLKDKEVYLVAEIVMYHNRRMYNVVSKIRSYKL